MGKYKQHYIQEVKLRHAFGLASAIAKSSQHNRSQLGPRKMTPHPVDTLLGTTWMEANEDGRDGGPMSAANLCSKLVETSDAARLSSAARDGGMASQGRCCCCRDKWDTGFQCPSGAISEHFPFFLNF